MKNGLNKKIGAGLLSVALLTAAIVPYINKQKAEAFSSAYGVCIDNHNVSTSGAWSKNDHYSNKMINMNEVEKAYGYGSTEYNYSLAKNVEMLHNIIGTDDQILKMFWAGIVTWVSGGKSFTPDNQSDQLGAQYWYNYAIQGYSDSVQHGYAPVLATYDFVPMSEEQLGTVIHGTAGQNIIDRDPLLAMLTNPHTLFAEGTYDPDRNYQTDPLAIPRLGNSWLNSYDATQNGKNGRATWPKDVTGHEVSGSTGFVPTLEQVQQAALDMETNLDYHSVNKTSKMLSEDIKNKSSKNKNDVENNEDSGTVTEKRSKYYVINCSEDFFNNCGWLKVWDNNFANWVSIGSLTHYGQTVNVNGWDIKPSSTPKSWTFEFTYTGGNDPTGLVMYFELPQNAVTSANTTGFNTTTEFVARYINVYTCDSCGASHASGRIAPSNHQRHISFYFDGVSKDCYPCFRLGGDDPNWEPVDANVNFEIFRHKEDWTSNYNVQLEKKDYETGKPLENSIFELYERFDDKGEINRDRDGAVELYEGGDETWQSKYTSSPVIWDDFRLVGSYTTDTEGHIEDDVTKGYHYEKTFCDGHPAPEFAEVPEPEEESDTEQHTKSSKL